jgi:hypothetical protein
MRSVTARRLIVAMAFGILGALVAIALDAAIAYLRRDWTNPVGIVLVTGVAAVSGVLPLLGGSRSSRSAAAPAPPATQPRRTRRSAKRVPLLVGVLVMLVLCGGGVAAASFGTRYVGGWLTGDETGTDHLAQERTARAGDLTLTVGRVMLTRHFTKVELSATNAGETPISLPISGNCHLIPDGDRQRLEGDPLRSHWSEQVPPGQTVRGTVTFPSLPEGVSTVSISFGTIFGELRDASIAITDISLS